MNQTQMANKDGSLTDHVFRRGDLVWVIRKRQRMWPGLITNYEDCNPPNPKKLVYFFGSNNYCWIEIKNLQPYVRKPMSRPTELFREARAAIHDVSKNGEDSVFFPAGVKISKTSKAIPLDKITPTTSKKSKRLSSVGKVSAKRKVSESSNSRGRTGQRGSASFSSKSPKLADAKKPEKISKTPAVSGSTNSLDSSLSPIQITNSVPDLLFGFIGQDSNMSTGIVNNILRLGHRVVVTKSTYINKKEFKEAATMVVKTPQDVVQVADITFSCASDTQGAMDVMFGNKGAINAMSESKGYVEMSTIDPNTSKVLSDAVQSFRGIYLEAQLQGSRVEAEERNLVILSAGDIRLYNACQSCFEAIGRRSFFFGDVGCASKMNLVLKLMSGTYLVGCAEALALGDQLGLQLPEVLKILSMTKLSNQYVLEKGKRMINRDFTVDHALKLMQKELNMGIDLSQTVNLPVPLAAISNSVMKTAKWLGSGDLDSSAVYIGL